MNADQLIEIGVGHHSAGRLADAEKYYRQALTAEPNQPEALYAIAVCIAQSGGAAEAVSRLAERNRKHAGDR